MSEIIKTPEQSGAEAKFWDAARRSTTTLPVVGWSSDGAPLVVVAARLAKVDAPRVTKRLGAFVGVDKPFTGIDPQKFIETLLFDDIAHESVAESTAYAIRDAIRDADLRSLIRDILREELRDAVKGEVA